jgi:hypothetical protein
MGIKDKSLQAVETGKVHIKRPNGEPAFFNNDPGRPISIDVYGPASKQYRKAKSDQANRSVELLRKRGNGFKTTEEAKAREAAVFLADITARMHNIEYTDDTSGAELSGRDLALAVYGDCTIGYMADQVHEFVHDWENFSQASPTP